MYKTLFTTNFVGNTYKFYNFVENNYQQRNYLSIKILRKNDRKKYFLANYFNKFTRKISCNMRIFSNETQTKYILYIDVQIYLFLNLNNDELIILVDGRSECLLYSTK